MKRKLELDMETVAKVQNMYRTYGQDMYIHTINRFLIEAQILPDLPAEFRDDYIKTPGGILVPGMIYQQEDPWEDYIDDVWDNIRMFKN